MSLTKIVKKKKKSSISNYLHDFKNSENKDEEEIAELNGDKFTNLHHHDEYSLRCAMGNTEEAIDLLKKYNYSHYAVTNYGEITGWVNQYFSCLDEKIVPILGMEAFVNNFRLSEDSSMVEFFGSSDYWKKEYKELDVDEKHELNLSYNLLLYAKDIDGYYNIIKCHNDSQLNGFFNKPRMTEKFLSEHGDGIICVAPSGTSEISYFIINGYDNEARKKCELYKKIFNDFYLELILTSEELYRDYNDMTVKFAQKYDIPCIVSYNSHYISKDDKEAYEAWMKLGRESRAGFNVEVSVEESLYYPSKNDMREVFENNCKTDIFVDEVYEEALKNVENICSSIDVLPLNTEPKMPKFEDAENVIKEKAWSGLKERKLDQNEKYVERLRYELDNVIRAGFADYFLFLEDVVSWCHKNDNKVGFGRGSGAGSLLLYTLNITQVDPVKYNLLFERFLDAARMDEIINRGEKITAEIMPDVDIDFENRDEVKDYLTNKYGREYTCTIGTIGRMKIKGLLQDLCRHYKISQQDIIKITTGELSEIGDDEEDWELKQLKETFKGLSSFLNKYPHLENIFNKLRGVVGYFGKHAGGVLVSNEPLTDQLPVRLVDGNVVSCWMEGKGGNELGRMGFIKMDILGIKTLNQIVETIDLIKKHHGRKLNMYDINIDDSRAISLANQYDTMGVFQFDSHLTKQVFSSMGGIKNFNDYAIASALMRPSALSARLHEKFGNRRSGKEKYEVPECLKETMGPTYGLTVFQESAYHVARHLCDFNIVEAYKFMKLLYKAKMKGSDVPKWRDKFMKGAKSKIDSGEITQQYADELFEDLLRFQGYGFNHSHSIAYSMFSAVQLYMKAYYPAESSCCLLRRTPRTKKDKTGFTLLDRRIQNIKRMGIKVFPPDINKSKENFYIEDGGIRFGLSGLKGISKAADEIIKNQPYKSVEDFCNKVSSRIIHKGRMESLIYAGCFDDMMDRLDALNFYYRWSKNKGKKKVKQMTFFDIEEDIEDNNDLVISFEEMKNKEIDILGAYLMIDLRQKYAVEIKRDKLKKLEEVEKRKIKYPTVICQVVGKNFFVTKKGIEYCRMAISDGVYDGLVLLSQSKYEGRIEYFEGRKVIALPLCSSDDFSVYFLNEKEEIKIIDDGVGL